MAILAYKLTQRPIKAILTELFFWAVAWIAVFGFAAIARLLRYSIIEQPIERPSKSLSALV
jgi:hypothetical protein